MLPPLPTGADDASAKKRSNAHASLRARLVHTQAIIIEERSLVSIERLYDVHSRLCLAFPENAQKPFAGFHVSLFLALKFEVV
jgi:hypothetical protein